MPPPKVTTSCVTRLSESSWWLRVRCWPRGCVSPCSPPEKRTRTSSLSSDVLPPEVRPNQKWLLGGSESLPCMARDRNVTRARCNDGVPEVWKRAAETGGQPGSILVGEPHATTQDASARCTKWKPRGKRHSLKDGDKDDNDIISILAPPILTCTLHAALNQALYYDEKLNPVVKPLMESIKKEPSEELQANSASTLAALLAQLVNRDPCPNNKVLVNLKAFLSLTASFGEELPEKLPKLWEFITEPFANIVSVEDFENQEVEAAEELVSRLQVFEAVCGHVHARLREEAREWARACCVLVRTRYTAVRHMAARALAALCRHHAVDTMHTLIHELVPALSDVRCERARCGAAEALARVTEALQLHVVPYIVLLVVPLLAVRIMSTRCFASLIQLMPLDGAIAEPAGLSAELRARRLRDKDFLDQLFNPKTIKDYKIPAGVNWLRFLYEYKLHGVLCDDMGLGKTLQSLAVVAGAHLERRRDGLPALPSLVVCPPTLTVQDAAVAGGGGGRAPGAAPRRAARPALAGRVSTYTHWYVHDQYKTLQSLAVVAGAHLERRRDGLPALPSLVVCPPTLTGMYMISTRRCSRWRWWRARTWSGAATGCPPCPRWSCVHLHSLYVGPPVERERLRYQVKHYNFIVASYDIVRKDIDFFSGIKWNYCVLDEGHVIKNGKTKAFKAIKQLFTARYSRPILSARDAKATPHQLQAGALACEALHRQVPYLLFNVLELWSLFDFLMPGLLGTERQSTARYSRLILSARDAKATPHQLQAGALACEALHRQNVCNHPKLVLTADHPQAAVIGRELSANHSNLDDIEHSAKLPALK
ncbi:Uncharacterized protein OBRU01_03844 [Operophtera brumata]|uniref:Helicase ATP-binding domain-containing protein n=1 Tax=Operophtera brumata TaxID=104452 RepID=A0A0L7LHB5_OPEBR|nr:Uncharacterized protein OBRU01_03844 [Operophtera brumata]